MSGGWTRRELAAACTSAALAALQACGREPREPAGGSPAKSGTLALTHGKADLRTPRDAPPSETWVYGLAPPETAAPARTPTFRRSEEHTSELQSPCNLVCRLLLEKKKNRRPPCP